jgi:transposase
MTSIIDHISLGVRDYDTAKRFYGRPILGSMAGPNLLAHVLVSKFDDHLPNRRSAIVELCNQGVIGTALTAIVEAICHEVPLRRLKANGNHF